MFKPLLVPIGSWNVCTIILYKHRNESYIRPENGVCESDLINLINPQLARTRWKRPNHLSRLDFLFQHHKGLVERVK